MMARTPVQVLVFPYRQDPDGTLQFAIFWRADVGCWQGIAGGGEADETPLQAAKRECFEEAGLTEAAFLALDAVASIPVVHFKDSAAWGEHVYVIPEYTFGVCVTTPDFTLSAEHREARWVSFEQAVELLKYESNKTALWELNQRVLGKGPRE